VRFLVLLVLVIGLVFLLALHHLPVSLSQANIPMQDVETNSDNKTASNANSSSVVIENMILKAELKPHEFLTDTYEANKFGFVASNNSQICPSNNCKYGIEDGQLSTFTNMSGRYIFEGKLKVTTVEEDVNKSKFYKFAVYLDKTGEEERNGETLQILEGYSSNIGLGKITFNPEISYDITNATLEENKKNPILTIQGEAYRSIIE
jgi:hypothetical protein